MLFIVTVECIDIPIISLTHGKFHLVFQNYTATAISYTLKSKLWENWEGKYVKLLQTVILNHCILYLPVKLFICCDYNKKSSNVNVLKVLLYHCL